MHMIPTGQILFETLRRWIYRQISKHEHQRWGAPNTLVTTTTTEAIIAWRTGPTRRMPDTIVIITPCAAAERDGFRFETKFEKMGVRKVFGFQFFV